MTSGLENPLSYFLVGLLVWFIAADGVNGSAAGGSRTAPTFIAADMSFMRARRRRWLFIVLALLVLNRFDYAALFLPLALVTAADSFKAHGMRGLWRDAWPGALLLFAWFAFALVYFGSPLPNTFYAKMAADYPVAMLLERAVDYFIFTANKNPVSLTIIAAAILASLADGRRVLLGMAAGQLLYLGFIAQAGGDWMPSGRFFSVPVFLAVGQLILAFTGKGGLAASRRWVVAGMLSLAIMFGALPGPHYPALAAINHYFGNAVRTHHAFDRRKWGLFSISRSRIAPQPRQRPEYYRRACWAGRSHLEQPTVWRIDFCALTDPFLARLPGMRTGKVKAGHHRRKLPTNYGEYLVGRAQTIPDESLRGLLHDVSLAARAPDLFTGKRFAALWRLNTGHYSDLDLSRYADPAVHIPAVTADVGFTVARSALDGPAKADGHELHSLDFPPGFFNSLRVVLDEPRPGAALQLSLSYQEGYEIRANGELVAAIDRVGAEGKLKNHTIPLPRPMMVETVDIRAMGRHRNRAFAVGHLFIQ